MKISSGEPPLYIRRTFQALKYCIAIVATPELINHEIFYTAEQIIKRLDAENTTSEFFTDKSCPILALG